MNGSKKIMKRAILCLLAVALTVSMAKADTLSGALTADNSFIAYLSTSPTVQGVGIASGTDWGTTYTLTPQALTPGTTYYLQIDGHNGIFPDYVGPNAGPGSIIGSFNLSGSSFQFSNGSQSLLTDAADWTYSYTAFGAAAITPTEWGANGVGPWGTRSGISGSAQWIWDANFDYAASDLFFETTITPLTSPIPEPGSLFLLGSGLLALSGLVARRRRAA